MGGQCQEVVLGIPVDGRWPGFSGLGGGKTGSSSEIASADLILKGMTSDVIPSIDPGYAI
jgi:hypothetical protein